MQVPVHSVALTEVTEWEDGTVRAVEDALAVEEPLEIRVNGTPVTVTMRTPGHDLELAIGFLLTEGIIESADEIAGTMDVPRAADLKIAAKSNTVDIKLRTQTFDADSLQRNFFAASSCGICGKSTIESIRRRGLRAPNPDFRVKPDVLCRMPDAIRVEQAVFDRTGGLHAAALFDAEGMLLALREDIGRHNAVDKVIGWAMKQTTFPLSESILMVSGRGGFEIAQKAVAAGIPVLASVSAPSSLAVELAREMGMTLIGFLRGRRFIVYAGASRCLPQE
ncbi:MAG: formate dehydrogenase accessory sulfurtransferase FdhD [Terracidiphilus sp.]